ncbi:DUF3466 family protein, partial [Vibrio diazotrophicus]|uniref:DUF3466 family protein n=1 Tax=Vibrio diazotrophicus TaxID=685 RepID=UPI001C379270
IQTSDKFKSYCNSELRYSTCNAWASPRWSAWSNEKSSTVPNSIAFMGSGTTGTPIDSGETLNVVINAIAPSVTPIGIDSQPANISGNVRQSVVARSDVSPPSGYDQTRAWASDGTYTVGSVSEYGTSYYRSHAAIWTSSSVAEIPWGSGASSSSTDHYAQGSIRDFVVEGSDIYGVGYNSYSSNNYMNATVFKIADDFSLLESIVVSNTQVKIDGNTVHSNSVVTSVNNNFVAIGSAKRAGNKPKSNAAANRLFIIDDVRLTNISANFPSGGILFDGAGGKAGAINNYNEIVGQIDIENTREVDGKPRRKRGFIYPYNAAGSDSTRMTRFANKAWYLDDLTNDGSLSGNNQYRVVDATDINDAGVISATALKCSGGYDTTAHNSTCGGGSQTETTVAVKLVPIVGATASDISERGIDTTTSERSGGSLGLWSLILLTLGWFRRK